MNTIEAVVIVEHPREYELSQLAEAWQYLVDTGEAFDFGGWYARVAMDFIKGGVIAPPNGILVKHEVKNCIICRHDSTNTFGMEGHGIEDDRCIPCRERQQRMKENIRRKLERINV